MLPFVTSFDRIVERIKTNLILHCIRVQTSSPRGIQHEIDLISLRGSFPIHLCIDVDVFMFVFMEYIQ